MNVSIKDLRSEVDCLKDKLLDVERKAMEVAMDPVTLERILVKILRKEEELKILNTLKIIGFVGIALAFFVIFLILFTEPI